MGAFSSKVLEDEDNILIAGDEGGVIEEGTKIVVIAIAVLTLAALVDALFSLGLELLVQGINNVVEATLVEMEERRHP